MTVKEMYVVFDENTRIEMYKKDYDGELVLIFDDILNYAEPWMLELYVAKAYVEKNGTVRCICWQ